MTTTTTQPQPTAANPLTIDRATIYVSGEFMGNINRYEVRDLKIYRAKYAQYASAIVCEFVQKGKRKRVRLVQSYKPSLLVLAGWGHPEPDGIYDDSTTEERFGGAIICKKGRYSSFDERWQSDFDKKIAEHIERSGAEVFADYRGANTNEPLA